MVVFAGSVIACAGSLRARIAAAIWMSFLVSCVGVVGLMLSAAESGFPAVDENAVIVVTGISAVVFGCVASVLLRKALALRG